MQYPIIKAYYDRLKEDSLEANVDAMWNNFLPLYFTIQKNHGVEQESNLYMVVNKRTNFSIRYVKNGVFEKIIVIEDKCVAYEAQSAIWAEAIVKHAD